MKSCKLIKNLIIPALLFSVLFTPVNSFSLERINEGVISDADSALLAITDEKEIIASVYLCDSYEVKEQASYNSNTVTTVYSGQSVSILSMSKDEDNNKWVYVHFYFRATEYYGYIMRDNLATSDEDFLAWEEEYFTEKLFTIKLFSTPMLFSASPNADATLQSAENDGEDINYYSEDVLQFPVSYRESLQALKDAHPNWTFVKLSTGLDFNTAVDNEMLGNRSLVSGSFDACTKEALYGTNWYYPSREILAYYMDPRNSLTQGTVFQFEQLTYNETYHTKSSLDLFLNTNFLNDSNKAPDQDITYSDIIWYICRAENVSPFFVAARIIQEQGSGTSALISGTYPGFEHYYNYFNYGANGTTTQEIIVNGLTYAKQHWSTGSYSSIEYGIKNLATSYILGGQDTLYLQKYNVSPSSTHATYTHQYMQNISAARTEGYSTYTMYSGAGATENNFVFKIPVYENMPDTPVSKPTTTTNAVLFLPETASSNGISSTPSVWIDGIEHSSVTRNGYLVVNTGNQTSTNAIVYKYNSSGICTGMYVWLMEYKNGAYVVTYESQLEDLLTYHGFSIRITGDSGIRFKTGISTSLKNTLKTTGVDGYTLSEYGTLVMSNSNRSAYPFIKGGTKVASGMAYGTDSSGALVDKVFETVDNRNRFTSVFVGLPVSQYKNDFAFRGYIVLSNGQRSVTLYGPAVANSIYTLANRLINLNSYSQGSAPDLFLRKIISDADEYTLQEESSNEE